MHVSETSGGRHAPLGAMAHVAFIVLLGGCDFDKPPANSTWSGSDEPIGETPQQRAATYAQRSTALTQQYEGRMRYPACTSEVPKGFQCGTLVAFRWREELRALCEAHEAPTTCAKKWLDGVHTKLEARYGGSAQATADLCGDDCADPFRLELTMLGGYNKRMQYELGQAREQLRLRMLREVADRQAAHEAEEKRRAEELATANAIAAGVSSALKGLQNAQPTACSQCGPGSLCVTSSDSSRGVCVR